MTRPLRYDGTGDTINIREMTDADLERLVYYVQVAYASQLNSSGKGYIFTGSGSTAIGSLQDTLTDPDEADIASPNNQPGGGSFPPAPGLEIIDGVTYNYQQDRTVPSFPNQATLNTDSYLCLNGSYDIKVAKDENDIITGVINAALTELKSGNEVGSYRVSNTSPGAEWVDKGTWFIDKYYNDVGNVTYKLWLKTSASTIPGSDVFPLKLFNNNVRPHSSILNSSDLVQNVLLPTMTRRLSTSTLLCYEVVSDEPTGDQNRGVFRDKRFNQSIDTTARIGSGASEIYRTTSTPNTSGTTQTINTRYLKYLG